MKIILNGFPAPVADGATVGAMIDSIGRGRKGLAVAVNDEVVPRSRWDATALHDDDRVEVLTASQGG
jgi:sulfur carrier protein